MTKAFSAVCRGLAILRQIDDSAVNRIRIRLHGTQLGWHQNDPKFLQEQAACSCIGDLVDESPERVSYHESLRLIQRANGLLILGVDDAGYVPSKLFSYLLSGKPLFAVLHASSPALAFFKDSPELTHTVRFGENRATSAETIAARLKAFISQMASGAVTDRKHWLRPYLAPAISLKHAALFDICTAGGGLDPAKPARHR
jgi:hypothetical protein